MYSIFFTSILFLSSLFGGMTYAQDLPKTIIDEAIEAGGVVVADVSIRNSQIVYQTLNEFEISFDIRNNGPEQQAGIMYGIQLVKEQQKDNDKRYVIIDEVIYPEEINLANGQTVQKTIKYVAPDILTGKYALHLQSQNKQGFPFAIRVLGEVELEATNTGIFINNTSCTISNKNVEGEQSKTIIKCSAENQLNSDVTVVPDVKVRTKSSFGEEIDVVVEKTEIKFSPLEKKEFEFALNGIEKTGVYSLNITLGGENIESNKAVLQYFVEGNILFISNIILDKEAYQKGDTANIKVLWAGNIFDVNSKIRLTSNGKLCAKESVGPLSISQTSPVASVDLEINRNCSNPEVSVELSDVDGNLLDSQEYNYNSLERGVNKNIMSFIYILAIVLVVLVGLFLKRKYLDKTEQSEI